MTLVYHKRYERTSLRADILRAFRIVRLGILTYSVVVRSKNHHKISRPQVPCSFDRADFCPGEKKDARNTPVFPSLLTMHGRKDAGQNLVCSYRLWYSIWYTNHIPKRYKPFGDAGAECFSMRYTAFSRVFHTPCFPYKKEVLRHFLFVFPAAPPLQAARNVI